MGRRLMLRKSLPLLLEMMCLSLRTQICRGQAAASGATGHLAAAGHAAAAGASETTRLAAGGGALGSGFWQVTDVHVDLLKECAGTEKLGWYGSFEGQCKC
jgi:hypothetical protein